MLAALRPRRATEIARAARPRAGAPARSSSRWSTRSRRCCGRAPTFTVQYGPTAVQWCSTPLLEAIARGFGAHRPAACTCTCWRPATSATGRTGISRTASSAISTSIGLLSPRLTLAHCTWARPDELELIAERGATISVNTTLEPAACGPASRRSPRWSRSGCRVAMGLDGLALDEDDDALREMRLADLLHGGIGFRIDVEPRADLKPSLVQRPPLGH